MGYAKPDFHRKMRQGVSEVIYGAGKTAEQIIGISKSFAKHGQKDILITRLDKTKAEKINKEIPLDYHDTANIGIIGSMPKERVGKIVIAVPTSVGYGASFGGIAALLSMLNSCASGVSVVNIDNGFGAAFQASMINHMGGLNE